MRHSVRFGVPIGISEGILENVGIKGEYWCICVMLSKIVEWYCSVDQGSGVHLGLRNEVCGVLGYAERLGVEEKSQVWLEGSV